MKKVLSLLAVAGVFTFASCESKKVEETNTTVEATEGTEEMNTEAPVTTDSVSTTTTTTTTDSAATTAPATPAQ